MEVAPSLDGIRGQDPGAGTLATALIHGRKDEARRVLPISPCRHFPNILIDESLQAGQNHQGWVSP